MMSLTMCPAAWIEHQYRMPSGAPAINSPAWSRSWIRHRREPDASESCGEPACAAFRRRYECFPALRPGFGERLPLIDKGAATAAFSINSALFCLGAKPRSWVPCGSAGPNCHGLFLSAGRRSLETLLCASALGAENRSWTRKYF